MCVIAPLKSLCVHVWSSARCECMCVCDRGPSVSMTGSVRYELWQARPSRVMTAGGGKTVFKEERECECERASDTRGRLVLHYPADWVMTAVFRTGNRSLSFGADDDEEITLNNNLHNISCSVSTRRQPAHFSINWFDSLPSFCAYTHLCLALSPEDKWQVRWK